MTLPLFILTGRSRKGAWIEIERFCKGMITLGSRSRKGAWIEIIQLFAYLPLPIVAPVRERGLKSAAEARLHIWLVVAPVRERGLKFKLLLLLLSCLMSLP